MKQSGFHLTIISIAVVLASVGLAAVLSGLTPEGDYIPPGSTSSVSSPADGDIPEDTSHESTPAPKPPTGGLKGGNEDAVQDGRLPGIEDKPVNSDPNNVFVYLYNRDVILPKPEEQGNIMVANDPGNTCPMQLCYYLEDSEELIYTSAVLYPNQYIEKDFLSKKLKKGTYRINAVISVYDEASMELKTTFHEEVTLTVNQKFLGLF